MKAKGPAAAKVEEDKKKGLVLFGAKPPTPKLLQALGGTINNKIINKMKVTSPLIVLNTYAHCSCALLSTKQMFFWFFLQTAAGQWKL